MTTRLGAGGQQQRRGGVAVVVQANLPNARITQQGAPRLVVEVFVERASIRLSDTRSQSCHPVPAEPQAVGLSSLRNTGARTEMFVSGFGSC
jgi:hypothetical protein